MALTPSLHHRIEDAQVFLELGVVLEHVVITRLGHHRLVGEYQRAVGHSRVFDHVADVGLRRGHRADVVDIVFHQPGDLRRVVEVHPLQRRQRVFRPLRDEHIVMPVHRPFFRDDELEVFVALGVGLVDVARPGHGNPGIAALQRLDVALVVVLPHQAFLALRHQFLRRLLPVFDRGRGRVDAEFEQAKVAILRGVLEHTDMALERRVPQIGHRGDLALGQLGVVANAGEARLPDRGVGVVRVVHRVEDAGIGVFPDIGQPLLPQRNGPALLQQFGELKAVVGHHRDVVAGGLAGLEQGFDLGEKLGVGLNRLQVLDRDAGLLAEHLQRGVLARLGDIDVERPVGEHQILGGLLRLPPVRPLCRAALDPSGLRHIGKAQHGQAQRGAGRREKAAAAQGELL